MAFFFILNKHLVNWDVLLNDWIFWKKQLFFIYYLHQNTWIPGWMNLFLSLVKWFGKKNQPPVRITFSSRTGQPMSTIWQPGKKEHLISRSPLSGCFWLKVIHTFKLLYSIPRDLKQICSQGILSFQYHIRSCQISEREKQDPLGTKLVVKYKGSIIWEN